MRLKPGDLVMSEICLNLHKSPESTRTYEPPPNEIGPHSIGIVLSSGNGLWIKWLVNGQVGWSNHTFLEIIE